MGKPKSAEYPWEMISMDFIGPLVRSRKGNTLIFVVIDFVSKYVLLKPMRTGKTPALVRYLEEEVFLTYNVPKIIISDNGPQFISNKFSNLLRDYNVKHWLTSRYTPQYNNTERLNRVIMSCIRSYLEGMHNRWDEQIPQIDTTKYSPFFINFGRNMITNGSQYENFIQPPNKTVSKIAEEKAENLKILLNDVKENIKKGSEEVSKRYNLRARDIQFNVGDIVFKKNFGLSSAPKGISAKLNDPFIKCIVQKRMGSNTYNLEDLNGCPLGVFHAKDIHK